MKNRILLIIILFISTSSFGLDGMQNKRPIDVKLKKDSSQIEFTSALKTGTNVKMDTIFIKNIIPNNHIESKNDNFVKTYLPSIIALFVLFVTNLVVLFKIRIESKETLKREITIASIKFDNTRLEDFYDPIFTTLSTNEGIFESFGPNSFPDDNDDLRNEASIIWNKMVENIILPNNQFISEIITKKSHLIIETDQLDKYLDFLKHAKSYEHFIKYPNSIHKGFKYNPEFKENVSTNRQILINRINKLKQNLKINGSKKRS